MPSKYLHSVAVENGWMDVYLWITHGFMRSANNYILFSLTFCDWDYMLRFFFVDTLICSSRRSTILPHETSSRQCANHQGRPGVSRVPGAFNPEEKLPTGGQEGRRGGPRPDYETLFKWTKETWRQRWSKRAAEADEVSERSGSRRRRSGRRGRTFPALRRRPERLQASTVQTGDGCVVAGFRDKEKKPKRQLL